MTPMAKAAPLGAALLLVLAGAGPRPAAAHTASNALHADAQPPAGVRTLRQQPDYLYVCNQDGSTVSIIDMAKLAVVQTVKTTDIGFGEHAKPHHVVVEPDGSFWYLTLIGENRVLKLSRDNKVVGQATFETPGLMTMLPKKHRIYVGRSMTAVNPPMRIGLIDPSNMSIDEIDVFYPRPHALESRPQEDYVYSASLAVNSIASVNTSTNEVKLDSLGGPAHALAHSAVSPDGRWMVITTHMPHMMVFDLSSPATPKLVKSVDVGELPWYPVFSRDGRYVYVANNGSNSVSVVECEDVGSDKDDHGSRPLRALRQRTLARWPLHLRDRQQQQGRVQAEGRSGAAQ